MSCPHHDNDVADGVSQQGKQGSHRLFRLWPRPWCRHCLRAASSDRRIANGLTQIQGETLSGRSLDRILDALGLPALPELSELDRVRLKARLRRLLLLIGLLLFVTTLAQPELIGQKAIETLWFGKAHPSVLQTAGMWLLFGLCWYGKPLLASLFAFLSPRALSDKTCLRWLAGSTLLAAFCWLALDHVHLRGAMALLVIVIGGLLAVASTVMGGTLVEQGQRMGATGRLGALHAAAIFLARLASAGAAGLLGTATLHLSAPFCAVLLAGFALLCWLLQERGAEARKTSSTPLRGEETDTAPNWERHRKETWSAVQTLLRSHNVWGAAGIAFLIYIAPNFAALQHQENIRLGLGGGAQDGIDFIGGAFGLIGVGGYLWLCRRLSLQTLFIIGILCNASGTLLYLGYHSLATALIIEGANGLLSALVFAMLFDLAIRVIPQRSAMLGYALFTGIIALSSHLSNVLGSWLTLQGGWGFLQVVSLSAALSLPALAVVALLPAALLDRREGRIVEETLTGRETNPGIPAYEPF